MTDLTFVAQDSTLTAALDGKRCLEEISALFVSIDFPFNDITGHLPGN